MTDAKRDNNGVTVMLGVSNADNTTPLPFTIDSATGRVLMSSTASLTVLTITGTVDDSNLAFTAASEPTVLVINGGVYKKTGGSITWTYSGGSITLSAPVGSGGSIFGL